VAVKRDRGDQCGVSLVEGSGGVGGGLRRKRRRRWPEYG